MQNPMLIDLYLSAVTHKLFTWDILLRFVKMEDKFKGLTEVEVSEVYSEIEKNYGNV